MVEVIQEAAGEIDGQPVSRFTLRNAQGVEVVILPWGAVIQSVRIPGRDGEFANVALGFADLATYVTGNIPFFGCVAGRYANVSVFDVESADELHELLSGLPLFPYMDIRVTPLARHPSAIDRP